jgi:hypothetical protein
MQVAALEWTLGCITSTAWGLLTIPGTLPPVPRARPFGARAVPPYSSGILRRLGGSPPILPTPLRGAACKYGTGCTKREAWAPTSTRCTGYRGGPKEWSQDATISPAQDARAWEEAARPQGLFPSYPRRSGREARGLHDMPTALHLREV